MPSWPGFARWRELALPAALALVAGCGGRVVLPPPEAPPRSRGLPLAVQIEVPRATETYQYVARTAGGARWTIDAGPAVAAYARHDLGAAFAPGYEAVVTVHLLSFALDAGGATCRVHVDVHRGGRRVFAKRYTGTGAPRGWTRLGGRHAQLAAATEHAIRDALRQFVSDATEQWRWWW